MTDYSRWYRAGTVKVTKDSANISGTSTFWNVGNPIRPGDLFTIDGAAFYEIADVTGADTLVLASPYKGASLATTTYAVIRNFSVLPGAELVAAQLQLISKSLLRERQLTDWATKPASDDPVYPTKVTITSFDGVAMEVYSLPQILDSGTKMADELGGAIAQTRDNLAKSNASRDAAKTSETNAAASAAAARTSEQNAKISESNSKTSETNAAASKTAAATSETNAASSKTAAAGSATAAATSATNASTSEGKAKTSETNAKTSETNAKTSETNAKTSETNAAGSATAAAASKTAAGTSETNAKASENAAAASKTAAATSETNAKTSETNAKASENAAAASKTAAATSETNAANSATAATAGAMFAMPREFSQKGKFFTLTNSVGPGSTDIPDANFVVEAGSGTVFKSTATSPVYPRPKGYLRNASGRTYRATAVARSIAGTSTLGLSILTVNDAMATSVMANIPANANLPKDGAWQTVSFQFTSGSTAPYATCQAIATAGTGATIELQALYIEDITDSQAASDSAAAAADSQSKAKTSETNSKTSETNAATSETNAAASKTAAAGSATAAATSATNAKTSETNAKTSETNAKSSETSAAASSSAAGGAKTAAETARDLAQQWADAPRNTEVQPGKFSARHWAETMQAASTGTLVYMGSWDASKGTLPATPKKGDFYIISVAGTVSSVSYKIGDMIVANDKNGWDRIDNQQTVTSVAGRTGAVTLGIGDISSLQTNLDTLTYAVKSALNAGEDLIPNPTFETRYDRMGFTVVASTDPDVPAGCPQPYVAKLAVRDHTPNFDPIPVQPGDVIEMTAVVASSVGTPGTNAFNLYVRQSQFSPWAPGGAGTYTYTNVKSQPISAGWVKVVGRYTVPANGSVRWILPFLQINQNSPDYGSIWYATDWHVRNLTSVAALESSKLDSAAFTWANLANKPTTFTPSAHTHAISEVTNLQRSLDLINFTAGRNLVSDGNFEKKLWDLTQSGAQGRVTYVTDSRSGSTAIQIAPGSGDVSFGMPVQTIPVVLGRTYRISCYYKTSADYNGASNNSKLRLGDSGGGLLIAPTFSSNKTSWTQVTGDYTVQPGVTGLQLSVNANQTVGTLTVDDVSIIDVTDDLGLLPLLATKLGKTGNQTYDGVTNTAAAWAALPMGYSSYMGNSSTIGIAGGAPNDNYGYFHKIANRDVSGGWAGLWIQAGSSDSFVGGTSDGSQFATWNKLWTSANFDPTTKLDKTATAASATSIAVVDTRDVVDAPGDFGAKQVFASFKRIASVNNPPVNNGGTYAHILTMMGWDIGGSGGYASQLSFGDGLAIRKGTNATTWGPWRNVWHDGNFNPNSKANLVGPTFSDIVYFKPVNGTTGLSRFMPFGTDGVSLDAVNSDASKYAPIAINGTDISLQAQNKITVTKSVVSTHVWSGPGQGVGAMAYQAGGSYGGGYAISDGDNDIALYSVGGALNISFGAKRGALISRVTVAPDGTTTVNGTVIANNASLRASGWNGTATDGVVYFGNANSYIFKQGGQFSFYNEQAGFTASLAAGGTIWTSALITPLDKNVGGVMMKEITFNGNGGGNGIYPGNGDNCSITANNLAIKSWNGIGFAPTISGQAVPLGEYSHWFDVRNGHFNMRGDLVARGSATIWGEASGNTLKARNGYVNSDQGHLVLGNNGTAGTIYMRPNGPYNGAGEFKVQSNGDAYCSAWVYAPNFKINSDARLKRFAEKLNPRQELEKIKKLIPRSYLKDGHWEFGFFAQEMEDHYPTMVTSGDGPAGPDTLTLSVAELLAPLVAAVQMLDKRLTDGGL
ncbi:carbohydrate binding domain-containing protein [Dyella telluris]|uniref:Tail fiber domain-containing protein n=1 Tax=Dyella telluris TaxID=2763498 RepID=A0A7G8Q4E9_9GAMM|nr:carbohydrate binding domain-containing protein [Dyella telluris]QNK01657.1 tail fiber domain-containing protein [Dyella telluris]